MIRCSECKIVDAEFVELECSYEQTLKCSECGEIDSAEEIDSDLWAEEMIEEEADRINDYLAIEGDNEEL